MLQGVWSFDPYLLKSSDYLPAVVLPSHISFPLSDRKLAAPEFKKRRIGDPLPGPPPRRAYDRGTKPWLHFLPIELLSEILSYLSTPTLLNVARADKWLCRTLLGPDARVIWARARENGSLSNLGIPPPLEIWPEPAYAALLFDGGKCIACERFTPSPPRWLYSKVWVCPSDTCLSKAYGFFRRVPVEEPGPAERTVKDAVFCQISTLSSNAQFGLGSGLILKTAWDAAEKELERVKDDPMALEDLFERWRKFNNRKPLITEHDLSYGSWFQPYTKQMVDIRGYNNNVWRNAGKEKGWNIQDLSSCPTLQQCTRRCLVENESFTPAMWALNEGAIALEIEALGLARSNRKNEKRRQSRKAEVEQYWKFAKSTKNYDRLFPTLKVFRSLPTITKLEQDPEAHPNLPKALRDSVHREAIHRDLDAFHLQTKKKLTKKLDTPQNNNSAAPLHICDRVTALFFCNKCDRAGRKHNQAATLDYSSAIKHRCPKSKGKQREWDIRSFQADKVAIEACRKAVISAGKDEASVTKEEVDKLGDRWKCLACPSGLIMPFRCIAGHAKRHDNIRKMIEQDNEAARTSSVQTGTPPVLNTVPPAFDLAYIESGDGAPEHPPPYPDTERLLGPSMWARRRRDERAYGCRYCPVKKAGQPPRLFTTNGLISHIMESHALHRVGKPKKTRYVFRLRDEDFYYMRNTEASLPASSSEDSVGEDDTEVGEVDVGDFEWEL